MKLSSLVQRLDPMMTPALSTSSVIYFVLCLYHDSSSNSLAHLLTAIRTYCLLFVQKALYLASQDLVSMTGHMPSIEPATHG